MPAIVLSGDYANRWTRSGMSESGDDFRSMPQHPTISSSSFAPVIPGGDGITSNTKTRVREDVVVEDTRSRTRQFALAQRGSATSSNIEFSTSTAGLVVDSHQSLSQSVGAVSSSRTSSFSGEGAAESGTGTLGSSASNSAAIPSLGSSSRAGLPRGPGPPPISTVRSPHLASSPPIGSPTDGLGSSARPPPLPTGGSRTASVSSPTLIVGTGGPSSSSSASIPGGGLNMNPNNLPTSTPSYQAIHDPFQQFFPASSARSFGSARSSGSGRMVGESARSNPDWITPPESSRSSRSTYSTASPHSRMSSIPDPDTEKIFLDTKSVFSYARHGHAKIVERCLHNGFDPDSQDHFGNTLFHVAAQNGNKKIAKLAIKYGGDMDRQNLKGNTGLHFFFAYGYHDVAEYFISKGANPSVRNIYKLTCRQGLKA
ncbi:unnamed protein product [Amoebophrya sp. A25]|nr:unnamed protein product [Amoebophrya sp. A25]|eukprot:GSA25T00000766001.1